MKIQLATSSDESALLDMMRECYQDSRKKGLVDWPSIKTALHALLNDTQAGEAYLIYDEQVTVGYMIICRGFSLENGGYFSWIEETYLREPDQEHYQENPFSI
ncbi:MAG: hypothetical protein ACE5H9_01615 [Anaerolineae bacterium]